MAHSAHDPVEEILKKSKEIEKLSLVARQLSMPSLPENRKKEIILEKRLTDADLLNTRLQQTISVLKKDLSDNMDHMNSLKRQILFLKKTKQDVLEKSSENLRRLNKQMRQMILAKKKADKNITILKQDMADKESHILFLKKELIKRGSDRRDSKTENILKKAVREIFELKKSNNALKKHINSFKEQALQAEEEHIPKTTLLKLAELKKELIKNKLKKEIFDKVTTKIKVLTKQGREKDDKIRVMESSLKKSINLISELKTKNARVSGSLSKKNHLITKLNSVVKKDRKNLFDLAKKHKELLKNNIFKEKEVIRLKKKDDYYQKIKSKSILLIDRLNLEKEKQAVLKKKLNNSHALITELKNLVKKLTAEHGIISRINKELVTKALALKKEITALDKKITEKDKLIEGHDIYYKSLIDLKLKPKLEMFAKRAEINAEKDAGVEIKIKYMKEIIGELMKKEIDLKTEVEVLKKRNKIKKKARKL